MPRTCSARKGLKPCRAAWSTCAGTITNPMTSDVANWIDQQAECNAFSGVALVQQRGVTVFEHAAGFAHRGHRVPLNIDTRMQVASVSKMITAIVALRLVEQGFLSLSQPVGELLAKEHKPTGLDARVTLHHLLSHTSGLPDYHDDDEAWDSWQSAMDELPGYKARGPLDILPLFINRDAVSVPGVEYRYCDANFVQTGIVIETITGRQFADVANEMVLIPAGMSRSGYFDIDLEPDNYATGYLMNEGPAETWRCNSFSLTGRGMPDGGMVSTVHDMARFMTSLRNAELLTPSSLELMLTPHGVNSDGTEVYGYGMELTLDGEILVRYGHGGSDPGVSTIVSHFRDSETTVIVLCNYDRGSWAVFQKLTTDSGLIN